MAQQLELLYDFQNKESSRCPKFTVLFHLPLSENGTIVRKGKTGKESKNI